MNSYPKEFTSGLAKSAAEVFSKSVAIDLKEYEPRKWGLEYQDDL